MSPPDWLERCERQREKAREAMRKRRVARWCFVGMVRVCSSFYFPRLDGRRGSGWPDDWLVFKQPGRTSRGRGSPLCSLGRSGIQAYGGVAIAQ